MVGDLRDLESLKRGMAGCEVVFHVAADYRLWAVNGQELYQSNVEGTRNILQAARDSGVRRVVYTSSVATMGFGNNGRMTDESSPVALSNMIGDYKRSKFMAEQLVIEAARGGQDVVMVNPTTPIGERDIKPTPTGQDCSGFPEAEVSGVCGYGAEPGGREGLRRRPPAGDGKGNSGRALHSGRQRT